MITQIKRAMLTFSELALWVLLLVVLLSGCTKPISADTASADAKPRPRRTAETSKSEHLTDTPLIPREVLFGNPERAQARLSHDGKWLSFTAPVDGVMNVWVAPVDDLSKA